MVDALTAKTDVQQNFKSAMGNSLRIDLLENKFYLNEPAAGGCNEQMAAINEMLTSLNEMIADSNENLADQGGEMVSENASWIDGEVDKMFKAASVDSNADLVKSNADRLEGLTGEGGCGCQECGIDRKAD